MADAVVGDKVEERVFVFFVVYNLVELCAVFYCQKYGACVDAQGFGEVVAVVFLCLAGFFVLFNYVGVVVLGAESCDDARLRVPAHLLAVKVHTGRVFADEIAVIDKLFKVFVCVVVNLLGVGVD